ncbi:response regulator transcription factor [Aliidiomarina sanyensis]|uniref:HTH luxR-type domain-containing protein n=1 Tax=Aliidiomarina sanyensis TaxID=1249555 RepID=A0A432WS03_9GAMM|nr:response regulator transcription factor [Aliidiomarina sanyensis]RUO36457.1 hypothetical protein CWE11_01170 [Aliidiomarina sanyensis]
MSEIILALGSEIRQAGLLAVLKRKQHSVQGVHIHRGEISAAAQSMRVPILMVDESNRQMSIRSLARSLRSEHPRIKVIACCDNLSHAMDLKLTEKYVDGFLFSHSGLDEVEKAVRVVTMGGAYSPRVLIEATRRYNRLNLQNPVFSGLSRRETQIFQLIATGLTVPDIAQRLFISRKTVNTFRYRLYQKLNVKGDVQLTHLAYEYGLLSPDLLKRCALYPQGTKALIDRETATRVAESKQPRYGKKK